MTTVFKMEGCSKQNSEPHISCLTFDVSIANLLSLQEKTTVNGNDITTTEITVPLGLNLSLVFESLVTGMGPVLVFYPLCILTNKNTPNADSSDFTYNDTPFDSSDSESCSQLITDRTENGDIYVSDKYMVFNSGNNIPGGGSYDGHVNLNVNASDTFFTCDGNGTRGFLLGSGLHMMFRPSLIPQREIQNTNSLISSGDCSSEGFNKKGSLQKIFLVPSWPFTDNYYNQMDTLTVFHSDAFYSSDSNTHFVDLCHSSSTDRFFTINLDRYTDIVSSLCMENSAEQEIMVIKNSSSLSPLTDLCSPGKTLFVYDEADMDTRSLIGIICESTQMGSVFVKSSMFHTPARDTLSPLFSLTGDFSHLWYGIQLVDPPPIGALEESSDDVKNGETAKFLCVEYLGPPEGITPSPDVNGDSINLEISLSIDCDDGTHNYFDFHSFSPISAVSSEIYNPPLLCRFIDSWMEETPIGCSLLVLASIPLLDEVLDSGNANSFQRMVTIEMSDREYISFVPISNNNNTTIIPEPESGILIFWETIKPYSSVVFPVLILLIFIGLKFFGLTGACFRCVGSIGRGVGHLFHSIISVSSIRKSSMGKRHDKMEIKMKEKKSSRKRDRRRKERRGAINISPYASTASPLSHSYSNSQDSSYTATYIDDTSSSHSPSMERNITEHKKKKNNESRSQKHSNRISERRSNYTRYKRKKAELKALSKLI